MGEVSPYRASMTIPEFIARCDAFCGRHHLSRTWLSKRLFSDTFRLDTLEAGTSDVGVRRLAKASCDLIALDRERSGDDEPGLSDRHDVAASVDDADLVAPDANDGAEKSLAVFSPAGGAA